jgi:hypothetical protein
MNFTDNFISRAETMVSYGVPVVPLPPRKKSAPPDGWKELATTNLDTIKAWTVAEDANCACVATLEGVWFLDIDNMPVVSEQILNATGHACREIVW